MAQFLSRSKTIFPFYFLCAIYLLSCAPKRDFKISIDKRDTTPYDSTLNRFRSTYPIISFIYFENGHYKVEVNNKQNGEGELLKNSSNESGGYECKNLHQNDTIKIEIDNYRAFKFNFDNRYQHIYLWNFDEDSIRIEFSNRQYVFE